MEEWYYALNGAQQGPVNRDVLMQLLGSGQLPADSLVWREGMGDWVAASTIPELWPQPAAAGGQQYPTPQPVLQYGVGDSAYHAAQYQFNYAGFWIRFAAWFIDAIATGVVGAIIGGVLGGIIGATMGNNQSMQLTVQGVSNVVGIVLGWLYFSLMWTSTKQASLGMMAVGIKVVDLTGARISFGKATGRYFASILSGCLVGAGYIMIAFNERKQSLHDQMAGTLVVFK